MKKTARVLVISIAAYAVLWGATRYVGPLALRKQMLRDAKVEWERCYREQEVRNEKYPELKNFDSIAYKAGPSVSVKLRRCFAPFWFEAETGRAIGGLNGVGEVGRYFVTPWKVYILSEVEIWVS